MSNEKQYTVYMHTNKINRKVYVGITSRNPEQRFGHNGYNYNKNKYFWSSIQKYGWDNFEHIIFAEGLNKEKAEEMERLLIALYDTTNPEYGYNHSVGGESGASGVHHSEETRKKWSDIRSKTVGQYDLYGNFIKTWKSTVQVGEYFNVDCCQISRVCNGEYVTSCGYMWRYIEGDIPIQKIQSAKEIMGNDKRYKPICQYDKDGNLIKIWDSANTAEKELCLSKGNITKCCKGRGKTYKGFLWKYYCEV